MSAPAAEVARAILDALQGGPAVGVATVVEGPHGSLARRLLFREDGTRLGTLGDPELDNAAAALAQRQLRAGGTAVEAITTPAGRWELLVEGHRPRERLLVVGAGHIAVPLAWYGHRLDFQVTVLDDREAFATPERFPPGAEVKRTDFAGDPFAGTPIDRHTYVALVTRGHRWDFDCLRRLVELPERPRYIGMIGSRRRVRAAFHALLEAGIPREELAGVHAPIGLEIGAETPEEIAVAIAAELVQVRRGGTGERTSERERVLERLLPEQR